MRRTGKRAFEPTMGSEGMSQLLMTYSIFMTRGPHKIAGSAARTERPRAGERGVFSHELQGARKTGTRRRPFESEPVSGPLPELHAISRFAVRVDVQALAFLFLGDAQSHEEVRDLEGDEGHHTRPHEYHPDCLGLDPELSQDRVVGRGGYLAREPIDRKTRPTQGRRVEHPGEQGAQDPPDRVDAEHVERVVRTEKLLQAVHAPQAYEARGGSDHERSGNADGSCSGGDCDEACNRAPGSADHARPALQDPLPANSRIDRA